MLNVTPGTNKVGEPFEVARQPCLEALAVIFASVGVRQNLRAYCELLLLKPSSTTSKSIAAGGRIEATEKL